MDTKLLESVFKRATDKELADLLEVYVNDADEHFLEREDPKTPHPRPTPMWLAVTRELVRRLRSGEHVR